MKGDTIKTESPCARVIARKLPVVLDIADGVVSTYVRTKSGNIVPAIAIETESGTYWRATVSEVCCIHGTTNTLFNYGE